MQRIHRTVGQKSRAAGVALAVLSLVFLVLSLIFNGNIIFQIDSVISLLAAIAVFLRGERSSMQIRIVNRMLDSSNQVLAEMSNYSFGPSAAFNYVPLGKKLADVVLVANSEIKRPTQIEASTDGGTTSVPRQSDLVQKEFIPPGRSLAELYVRELGVVVSIDSLIQSLRTVICDKFELASSVSVKQTEGNRIEIALKNPAVRQSCTSGPTPGVVGCPLSSMLAVLFCYASNRPVSLEQCAYQLEGDRLEISLGLGQR